MAIITQELSDRLDKAIQALQFLHEDLYADERNVRDTSLGKMQETAENAAQEIVHLMLECNIAIGQYAVKQLAIRNSAEEVL